mgnify:CR=1 FL=1
MTATSHSRYITDQGHQLAVYDWSLPDDALPRAQVLLVHGLGEHSSRYDALALHLNTLGFAVRGFDQHGHGYSDGKPGALPEQTRLLDDLAELVDDTHSMLKRTFDQPVPVLLLGHSMGGAVAAQFVALARRPVAALVLSSPAFDPGLRPWQKRLLGLLHSRWPNLRLANGLKVPRLCRDPYVVQAYQRDNRVHSRVSVRLAHFIAEAGRAAVSSAPLWTVPTLLLYAGQDHLVNPAGSRAFASGAPPCVQAHCFADCYHELFNEPEPSRGEVLACLQTWLDVQFPASN